MPYVKANRDYRATEETESIISLPKQKAPGPDWFIGEFDQTFKEEIVQSLPENWSRGNTS